MFCYEFADKAVSYIFIGRKLIAGAASIFPIVTAAAEYQYMDLKSRLKNGGKEVL